MRYSISQEYNHYDRSAACHHPVRAHRLPVPCRPARVSTCDRRPLLQVAGREQQTGCLAQPTTRTFSGKTLRSSLWCAAMRASTTPMTRAMTTAPSRSRTSEWSSWPANCADVAACVPPRCMDGRKDSIPLSRDQPKNRRKTSILHPIHSPNIKEMKLCSLLAENGVTML